MSQTYVFLMSRKKQGTSSGISLDPAERTRYGYPGNPQMFSSIPAQSASPTFPSGSYRGAPGLNASCVQFNDTSSKGTNSYSPQSQTNPRLRPNSTSRLNLELRSPPGNRNDVTSPLTPGGPKKYNRRTAPSGGTSSSFQSFQPTEARTLPPIRTVTRYPESIEDRRGKIEDFQPIEVKAKTWSRLSNNNLTSVDSTSNLNIPSAVHAFRNDHFNSSKSTPGSLSTNDLRLRGSRTEINVPIRGGRGREYSTSTTELAMKTSSPSRQPFSDKCEPSPSRARARFNSTTSLQVSQQNERNRDYSVSGSTSISDLRSSSVAYRGPKLETSDSGLEMALERAKQKVASDQRKVSTTNIMIRSSNQNLSDQQNNEVRGRPTAANRLLSDPLFDPTMPRLIPPSNRLASNPPTAKSEVSISVGGGTANQNQMTAREIANQIELLEQFEAQTNILKSVTPQNNYSQAGLTKKDNNAPNNVSSYGITLNATGSRNGVGEASTSSRTRDYVMANSPQTRNQPSTSLERRSQTTTSSTIRTSSERRVASRNTSRNMEHFSDDSSYDRTYYPSSGRNAFTTNTPSSSSFRRI